MCLNIFHAEDSLPDLLLSYGFVVCRGSDCFLYLLWLNDSEASKYFL